MLHLVLLLAPQVRPSLPVLEYSHEDLAHLNISKEASHGKGRAGTGDKIFAKILHSKPANNLQTLPLWSDDAWTWEWHRPRASWNPKGHLQRLQLHVGEKKKKKGAQMELAQGIQVRGKFWGSSEV